MWTALSSQQLLGGSLTPVSLNLTRFVHWGGAMGKNRVTQARPDLLAVDIGQKPKLWVEAKLPVPAAKQTNLRRPRGEIVRA
jgi:hypothetical protein